MNLNDLETAVKETMNGLPQPIVDALIDVELMICENPEEAQKELKAELGDEFKEEVTADCKGMFVGAPTEIEENDDSEEEEIVYYPEGFVVLCASNIESPAEGTVVLMHEIGHALGMSEEEVAQLGLGVQKEGEKKDAAHEGSG